MVVRQIGSALLVAALLIGGSNVALAQNQPAGDTPAAITNNDDEGFDWGWLGLLGLIGLAGLARKDRNRVGETTYGRTTTTAPR